MQRILAGEADAIIVWKVSRLSRNWWQAAENLELLERDAITDRAATSELLGASLARTRHLRSRPHWPKARCTNSLHTHPHSMVHCHQRPRREPVLPHSIPGPGREPAPVQCPAPAPGHRPDPSPPGAPRRRARARSQAPPRGSRSSGPGPPAARPGRRRARRRRRATRCRLG